MAATRRYFGTDGIRGRVGEAPITPDFVMKLGWAAGRVLGEESGRRVLIGKDTRISGYMFESALEAGLSAAGADILLTGPMPTPAIAYLTRTFRCHAGIVISASHNPFEDNGIKFFSRDGSKLPDAIERRIEEEMDRPLSVVPSHALGKARRVEDAPGRYIEFCKSTLGSGVSLHGLRLVVDAAHGAGYYVAPRVFAELGAEVVSMGDEPDGLNINDGCGATAPQALQRRVVEAGAHAGIALDGDGDRLIMVDESGNVVDGDQLLYIIARHRHARGCLGEAVVGTLMSNLGLELAMRRMGVGFHRAQVGDRYVLELLREGGWRLGGEGSGHIICLDLTTTGDGLVSALQVLEAMVSSGSGLAELAADMEKLPQRLVNVRVGSRCQPDALAPVRDAVRAVESELGAEGRVLLRPSGTEPVVRVMVEGRDEAQVERLAHQLAAVVEEAMAAELRPRAAAR